MTGATWSSRSRGRPRGPSESPPRRRPRRRRLRQSRRARTGANQVVVDVAAVSLNYVIYLARELDQLAAAASADERERMAELFELATRYEIAFWEMALTAETWPGIPDGD